MNEKLSIIRRQEVQSRTGLACSTLYRLMEQGLFPRQVKLSRKSAGWVEGEVNEWISGRIAQRKEAVKC